MHPLVPSRHPAKTAAPGTPPGWAPTTATITLLTSLGVLVVGQMYTVLALLSPMALSLHTTPEQVTWTATSFGFAYAAGFLVVGPLTDRYGPRAVMTAGLVAATAATAVVSAAPDLTWAIALRMVQGLTAAAFAPAAFSYVTHHIAPKRRAMALTCVTSGMLGAAVLMQIAAQAVAAGPGWRAVFLLSAALMALSLLPVHRTLRPTPRQDTGGLLHAFAAMPRLLRRGRLLALYAATVTLMAGFVALYTAVSVAGPPGIAGNPTAILTLRASALPALVAVPLLAPTLSRLAAPKRLVLALGVAAVTATAASLLGGHTILLAVALLLFVGAVATAAPAVVETVNATAPHARGAAVALYACSMFIGASLGPQLAGALTGQGFGTILRAAAAGLALGAALALPALRRRHPE
ncbi:MFS transporter [Streptomyces sp. HB132]|uniref:MFS transporter n=1 Tax=Streptomyces sp. HB132 TaxID=767388 RepID=UPI00196131CF|nr:MFS transporter [Streptomyces sp. HB132]MBM7439579.1 putative MFS family arabinose efflux permease [Streptomyces sp. HB132]